MTSSSPTTLNFPIARTGDTSYDAFVQYQTENRTAIAGTDYTAAIGSLVIPAGMTSATIPVTVAGSSSNPPDKTFQMLLLGGGGAARSFTPSFATQQTFAVGSEPVASIDKRWLSMTTCSFAATASQGTSLSRRLLRRRERRSSPVESDLSWSTL